MGGWAFDWGAPPPLRPAVHLTCLCDGTIFKLGEANF